MDVEPGEFTIERALQDARLLKMFHYGDWGTLRLKPGVYRLSQPIVIRPEDDMINFLADGDVTITGGGVIYKAMY